MLPEIHKCSVLPPYPGSCCTGRDDADGNREFLSGREDLLCVPGLSPVGEQYAGNCPA